MELRLLTETQIETIYNTRMKEDFPENELKPLSMIKAGVRSGIYECYGLFPDANFLSAPPASVMTPETSTKASPETSSEALPGPTLLGYTFFIKSGLDYLVDYLAIFKEHRSEGLGSTTLRLIKEKLAHANSILVEIENPDRSENSEEWVIRTRRQRFYLRNGLIDTGVRLTCFEAPFIMLEIVPEKRTDKLLTPEEVFALYKKDLTTLISEDNFHANVILD